MIAVTAILVFTIAPISSTHVDPNNNHDCGANEYYAESGAMCEGCGPKCLALIYEAKCYCKPGFSRFIGICVPDEICPQELPPVPFCPENEEFSECGSGCPQTCKTLMSGDQIACAAVCAEGCFCIEGLIRNSQGICVPPSLCEPDPNNNDCGLNEYYAESGPMCEGCGPRCLALIYEAKCYCKPGFSRFNGLCIPDEFCPPEFPPGPICPANEEFSDCGSGCPQTCETLKSGDQIACAAVCVEGCFCIEGLIRNSEGICVPPSQCEPVPKCPINEHYMECGSACPETCETVNKPGGRACAAVCVKGCFCDEGLFRNKQGICVPRSQCLSDITCPLNEVPGCEQPSGCLTCEHKEPCPTFVCSHGCVCEEGFYRSNGICIPEKFCPTPTCPVNEHYTECGSGCAETCETINKPAERGCAAVCVKGCFCDEGLIRNKKGICVPPSQCTSVPTCPADEHYTECGSSCPKTCETINKPGERACATVCVKGCFCDEGLVRNKKGICVPPSQCKSVPTCPDNEHYTECGSACPKTCETINKPGGRACAAVCVKGCFCDQGLIRNEKGICVPPSQCTSGPVCPANEEFLTCGSGCAPTCDDIARPGGRGCAAVCVEGCFCKKGLVRNKGNVCVLPSQCRQNTICPPNEVPGCEQPSECQTCEHKQLCPTFVCNDGCVCKEGFYRRNGICIAEKFCSNWPPQPEC